MAPAGRGALGLRTGSNPAVTGPTAQSRGGRVLLGLALTGWAFLLPSLLFLAALRAYPLAYTGYLSAFSWSLTRPDQMRFVGATNYASILSSAPFWDSIRVTVVFTLGAVSIQLVLGFLLALFLNRDIRGISLLRTVVIMPMMITPVVVGILWRILLNEDRGLVTYYVSQLGLGQPLWFSNPSLALSSLVLVDIWQWTPFVALLLLAGLQSLSRDPYEAAAIDGASAWQRFRYITLPLMRPFLLVAFLLRGMDAFRVFDIVFVLTSGGPGRATEVISLTAFRSAFRFFEMGYTAALTIILLGLMLSANFGLLRLFQRRDGLGQQ